MKCESKMFILGGPKSVIETAARKKTGDYDLIVDDDFGVILERRNSK
jgi:hypothetical protein